MCRDGQRGSEEERKRRGADGGMGRCGVRVGLLLFFFSFLNHSTVLFYKS